MDNQIIAWIRGNSWFSIATHEIGRLDHATKSAVVNLESQALIRDDLKLFPAARLLSEHDGKLFLQVATQGVTPKLHVIFPINGPPFPSTRTSDITSLFPDNQRGLIEIHGITQKIPCLIIDHKSNREWDTAISGSRFAKVLVEERSRDGLDLMQCELNILEDRSFARSLLRLIDCDVAYLYIRSPKVILANNRGIQFISQANPPKPEDDDWKIENCQFATDITIYSTGIPYLSFWFGGPRTDSREPELNLRDRRTLANTLATMRRVQDEYGYEYYSNRFAQLFSYIESRDRISKRLLFWLHGGYHFILKPLLCAVGFLLLSAGMVNALGYENPFVITINLKDSLEKVILSDLNFHRSIADVAVLKILLLPTQLAFYYFAFCFGLAVKRRFGFPKQQV